MNGLFIHWSDPGAEGCCCSLNALLQSQAFAQQAVRGPNESTMTLTLDFQDKIFTKSYVMNGMFLNVLYKAVVDTVLVV